jgi:Protein of unknown function (DUF4246)
MAAYTCTDGFVNEEDISQLHGWVDSHQGRCLAFPNTFQHRVSPMELIDTARPGSRKIIAFFLVNPASRVISTAAVPPQQAEWLGSEIKAVPGSRFDEIPEEIAVEVAERAGYPLSRATANKLRKQLMKERKYAVSAQNEQVFERTFSLCEH